MSNLRVDQLHLRSLNSTFEVAPYEIRTTTSCSKEGQFDECRNFYVDTDEADVKKNRA